MGNTILTNNDPVIKVTLSYPDDVSAPTDGTYSPTYNASVTVENTSQLPLASSSVRVTLDDDLMGYDAEIWNSATNTPASIATLDTGALQPAKQATKQFKFRVKKTFMEPPAQSQRTMTFHVMPSYEIKHQMVDGYSSQTRITVNDGESLGGGAEWTTNPPNWLVAPNPADPIIELKQSYFSVLISKTTGWNEGYTPTPRIYVASALQVTNKAPVPITFFKYQIGVDDDLSNYDLKCLTTGGSWGQAGISDDLGQINPNTTTEKYNYWIAVFHIDGAQMASTNGTGRLQVAPWYKVEYQRDDSLNHSIPVNV